MVCYMVPTFKPGQIIKHIWTKNDFLIITDISQLDNLHRYHVQNSGKYKGVHDFLLVEVSYTLYSDIFTYENATIWSNDVP